MLIVGVSFAEAYGLSPQSRYELYLDTDTPPMLLYVEDAQGRIIGANPNLSVSASGMQQSDFQEIPDSYVEQNNFNAKGPALPPTDWVIHIYCNGPQTYTAFCKGVSSGLNSVKFITEYWENVQEGNDELVTLLVSPNVTRKLNVQFNPQDQVLKITRLVVPGDLLSDVQSACEQH